MPWRKPAMPLLENHIAVVTGGPSLVGENYPEIFGGPYKYMDKDTGSLVVYTLE